MVVIQQDVICGFPNKHTKHSFTSFSSELYLLPEALASLPCHTANLAVATLPSQSPLKTNPILQMSKSGSPSCLYRFSKLSVCRYFSSKKQLQQQHVGKEALQKLGKLGCKNVVSPVTTVYLICSRFDMMTVQRSTTLLAIEAF